MLCMLAACLIGGIVATGGCSKDPGSMGKADIEAKLKETLRLKDVSLAASPDGGYAGGGTGDDGAKYTISVTQKQQERSLWYTAKDEKGKVKAGGFKQY